MPSVRITADLLTLLMSCALILYVSGGLYSLTSTPNVRFLRSFSLQVLFTVRVFGRNLLRGNCRRNIFFILRFDGIQIWDFLCIISQHTTYQTTVTSPKNTVSIKYAHYKFHRLCITVSEKSRRCTYSKTQEFYLYLLQMPCGLIFLSLRT